MAYRVFVERTKLLGPVDHLTLNSQVLVGKLLRNLDLFTQSLPTCMEVWVKNIVHRGFYHTATIFAQFELAYCCHGIGAHKTALFLFDELLEKRALGPDVWGTMSETAEALSARIRVLIALKFYERALADVDLVLHLYPTELSRERRFDVVETCMLLSSALVSAGDTDKAVQLLSKLVNYCERQSNNVGEIAKIPVLQQLAAVRLDRKEYALALGLAKNVNSSIHFNTEFGAAERRASAYELAKVLNAMGRYEEARQHARYAWIGELFDFHRGPNDPSTRNAAATFLESLYKCGATEETLLVESLMSTLPNLPLLATNSVGS